MRNQIKRIVTWMLVVFLAIGGTTAYAQTGETSTTTTANASSAVKITFPDTRTHWSQKHVAKLASLGIVNGKSDGTYGVSDNITQQEVIVMAVRLMGAEEQAKQLDTNVGVALQGVGDWARPHVIYAINNGIILLSEESTNNGFINWGGRSAKREWVAKVMVRALGKQLDAQAAANIPTKFNDNADISPDTLGYVNAAVKLGIITGTTSNDFLPLKSITRAETASVFAKAEQYLSQHEDVVKGYVSSITSDTLRVRDTSGEIHQVSMTNQTAYYRHDQNFQVLRTEVRVGREVYVVAPNSSAIYVEVLSDEEPTESITGALVAVDTVTQMITVKVDGKEVKYLLEESVGVIDTDGSGSSVSQLVPLSALELKKSTVTNRIVEIIVKDKPISKNSSGVIVSVTEDAIMIRDSVSEQIETYPYSTQILATHNGSILMLTDLKPSDLIEYRIVHGHVSEIIVTTKYVEPIRGTVDYLIDTKTLLIRNAEGKPDAYDLADNVQVQLEGMAAPTLKDLYPGDAVTLHFNSNDLVHTIKIENRTINYLQMLKFFAYDPDINEIVVTEKTGFQILKLTEDTILEVYGLEYPVKDLTKYVTANQRIDLVLTGDYVQRIKRSDSYIGTVKDYNPTTRRLVINNPSIGDINLSLGTNAFVQMMNNPFVTLSDLNIGDEVKVILGQDQLTVSQIQVKTNLKHTIDSVNVGARHLTLRDTDNSIRYVNITSNVTIEHPSKAFATINDLKAGQTVTVTYYGTSVASVNIVETSYGRVESVDRINNKLVILTSDDKIKTVDIDERFELYKGSAKVSVSTLLPGDRISISADKDGYTFAQVVLKLMKTMNKLEPDNQISFTNPLGEVEKYKLAEKVHVRTGTRAINLTDLRLNDTLYVYIVNDEIVEIEKQ